MPRTLVLSASIAATMLAVRAWAQTPAPPPGAQPAHGAEPAPAQPAALRSAPADFFTARPDRWTIQFEPAAWYVSPGGNLHLPGTPSGIDNAEVGALDLDSPRFTPFGELHIRSDQWRITLSGFAFSEQDRGATQQVAGQIGRVTFVPGDRLVSSLDIAAFEAHAGYTFRPKELQGDQFKLSIEPLAGARFYNLDFHVSGPSGSDSAREFFGHPFVGAKLTMDVLRDFTIDVQLDLGYFPSGSGSATAYDVIAGFTWRPADNVGVQIGYRDLGFFLTSGSGADRFEYDGALQGLYLGAVVRF